MVAGRAVVVIRFGKGLKLIKMSEIWWRLTIYLQV